jgi:hypothetical protein
VIVMHQLEKLQHPPSWLPYATIDI